MLTRADLRYIAVAHGNQTHVWKTPSHLVREFAPFVLHRVYTGHHDEVISITWSKSSRFFVTTSRDMTAKLYTLHPTEGFKPKTFAGHRDVVVGAYFSADEKTVSLHCGRLFLQRAENANVDIHGIP